MNFWVICMQLHSIVNCENISTIDSETLIFYNLTDRPGKPEGPLEVSDVYKDRCKVKWNPPKDDGGVPIDHYIVEKMDTKKGKSSAGYVLKFKNLKVLR